LVAALTDACVAVAADIVRCPPEAMRPALRAALTRAAQLQLGIDELVSGLERNSAALPGSTGERAALSPLTSAPAKK
jgi:hypothetical protein